MDNNLKTYGDLKQAIKSTLFAQRKKNVGGVIVDNILGAIPGIAQAKTLYDFIKAASNRKDDRKTDTWLDKLDIDDDMSQIVDDTVENGFIQFISKILDDKPDNTPLDSNFNMNQELVDYLKKNYNERTISGIKENKKMNKQHLKQIIKEEFQKAKKEGLIKKTKKEINEISPELFRKATDISRFKGQDQRTTEMGKTFFNKFKGKPLMGGTIEDVLYSKPQQGNYEQVGIKIKYIAPDSNKITNKYLYYDVKEDEWDVNTEIIRADARLLTLIAQHINPKTKYKSGSEGFGIKGYGMSESIKEAVENLRVLKSKSNEGNDQITLSVLGAGFNDNQITLSIEEAKALKELAKQFVSNRKAISKAVNTPDKNSTQSIVGINPEGLRCAIYRKEGSIYKGYDEETGSGTGYLEANQSITYSIADMSELNEVAPPIKQTSASKQYAQSSQTASTLQTKSSAIKNINDFPDTFKTWFSSLGISKNPGITQTALIQKMKPVFDSLGIKK